MSDISESCSFKLTVSLLTYLLLLVGLGKKSKFCELFNESYEEFCYSYKSTDFNCYKALVNLFCAIIFSSLLPFFAYSRAASINVEFRLIALLLSFIPVSLQISTEFIRTCLSTHMKVTNFSLFLDDLKILVKFRVSYEITLSTSISRLWPSATVV